MSWTYYDKRPRRARELSCGDQQVYLAYSLRRVQCGWCGGVKSERLDWLADHPLYTKRFAFYVGRRCQPTPLQEVAAERFLAGHAVKELDNLNNKIRAIQRRAYGFRDEEYLRLKILTCMLPKL